jgi:sugar phosphate isomerase/epimerase
MDYRYTGFADEVSSDLGVQIETTKRAGWSSIELRKVGKKNVCALEPDEWKHASETLKAAGITVAGFGSALCNWGRPISSDFQADIDDLTRAIPYMKDAGTNLIRIMSYPNARPEPWDVADWKKEVFKRLRELARIAEDNDIILGHENCSGYASLSPENYLETVDAVNSPNFKLTFDTGNNTGHSGEGYAGTWAFYEACRDHIVHIHIKSFKKSEDGEWKTCFPDEDPVQTRILADAVSRGYNGWISIEPHLTAAIHAGVQSEDWQKSADVYVEYTQRLEKMMASMA